MFPNLTATLSSLSSSSSPAPSPPPSPLTALPYPIKTRVLAFLAPRDLLSLAGTCKALNRLAVPVYLQRYGVPLSFSQHHDHDHDEGPGAASKLNERGGAWGRGWEVGGPFTEDVKRGLRIAAAAGTRLRMRRVVVRVERWVGRPQGGRDAGEEGWDVVREVKDILEIGVEVDEVRLCVGDVSEPSPPEKRRVGSRRGRKAKANLKALEYLQRATEGCAALDAGRGGGEGEAEPDPEENAGECPLGRALERDDGGKTWVALLDALVWRGRCRVLTVDMLSTHRSQAPLRAIEDAVLSYLYSPASRLLRPLRSFSRAIVPTACRLEKFVVRSDALFRPPLLRWTLGTLASWTVREVEMGGMQRVPWDVWGVVLSAIWVPNLTVFKVDACNIGRNDLWTFLQRHSGVEELHLGRGVGEKNVVGLPEPSDGGAVRSWFGLASSKRAFLPHLHTLSAPVPMVVALLSSPASHPFPNLKKVTVLWFDDELNGVKRPSKSSSPFGSSSSPLSLRRYGMSATTGHIQTSDAPTPMVDRLNWDLAPVCLRLRRVVDGPVQGEVCLKVVSGTGTFAAGTHHSEGGASSASSWVAGPGRANDTATATATGRAVNAKFGGGAFGGRMWRGPPPPTPTPLPPTSTARPRFDLGHSSYSAGGGGRGRAVGWAANRTGALQVEDGEVPEEVTFASSCVTQVEVELKVYEVPEGVCGLLPQWLRSFAKLRVVEVRTLGSPEGDEVVVDGFMRAVGRVCPLLKRVVVDGREMGLPGRMARSQRAW